MHAREFGSQLTNVLRCPQLEAHGYQVIVTELVGWQHSMKNERIIATRRLAENARVAGTDPAKRPKELLEEFGLGPLTQRFFLPG